MGLYFSGMTKENKLHLSLSLSFQVSILNKKLLTTTQLSASGQMQFCALIPAGSFSSVI